MREEMMISLCKVLHDTFCSESNVAACSVWQRREGTTGIFFFCHCHYSRKVFLVDNRTASKPHRNAVGQDARHWGFIKSHQQLAAADVDCWGTTGSGGAVVLLSCDEDSMWSSKFWANLLSVFFLFYVCPSVRDRTVKIWEARGFLEEGLHWAPTLPSSGQKQRTANPETWARSSPTSKNKYETKLFPILTWWRPAESRVREFSSAVYSVWQS